MATTATTSRPVGPADLDAVCALVAACDLAAVGFVDFTPDDLAVDLRGPTCLTTGWYAGEGTLVGYGWVRRNELSNQVDVEVYVLPTYDEGLGDEILARLEERARDLAVEAGHADPWLSAGAYRSDQRTRGWLERAGYRVDTTFTRMRIDFGEHEPADPADMADTAVAVRRVGTEDDLRVAHRIQNESFVDHYGNVQIAFEEWQRRLTEQGPDHSEVYLADLDGVPVGVLVGTRQFEEDDNAGYVRTLGVLPVGRGRGVGTALLRDYFARSRRAGRAAVLLHVDVANVTGALRLYESVGMRNVLEIDAWAKGTRAD